jgi:hypothetical protein
MALIKVNNRGQSADFSTEIGATKNLIINGAMQVDQRYGGSSVTIPAYTDTYVMDRWNGYGQPDASKYSLRQVAADGAALAAGFINCAQVTSAGAHTQTASDIYFIRQFIEGNRMAHLRWGTSDAKACSLSFWVKSHKTGTHGGSILDAVSTWAHPFTYSVSSSNTWEYKTVSIAGPTAGGTFNTDNQKGCQVVFSLSVGSSFSGTAGAWANSPNSFGATGAVNVLDSASTWSVTGVQLEVGTTATDFEHRSFGEEFQLCQRYYSKASQYGSAWNAGTKQSGSFASHGASNGWFGPIEFPVTMRIAPTMQQTGTQSYNGSAWSSWSTVTMGARTENSCYADCAGGVSTSNGQSMLLQMYWDANAEL